MTRTATRATAHDRKLLERLSAYLDGDLLAKECDAIARHAETCERCAAVLADFKHDGPVSKGGEAAAAGRCAEPRTGQNYGADGTALGRR